MLGLRAAELSSRSATMKYAVVIEKASCNYSAYVPDLPGCVATGRTRPVVLKRIAEAIAMHLDGMREDGASIPEPTTTTGFVRLARRVTRQSAQRKAG